MPLSTTYRVEHGQLIGARQIASPNYNQRPESAEIQLIAVSYTHLTLPTSRLV